MFSGRRLALAGALLLLTAGRCQPPTPKVEAAPIAHPQPTGTPTDTCLDEALTRAHLNSYGDPPGTVYAGGTPLFDEKTGQVTSRRDYIRRRHPELAAMCNDSRTDRP